MCVLEGSVGRGISSIFKCKDKPYHSRFKIAILQKPQGILNIDQKKQGISRSWKFCCTNVPKSCKKPARGRGYSRHIRLKFGLLVSSRFYEYFVFWGG